MYATLLLQNQSLRLSLLGLLVLTTELWAAPATVAGNVSLPEPTLQHISVVWSISGDDDFDGVVSVRYRPFGTARPATPATLSSVLSAAQAGWSIC